MEQEKFPWIKGRPIELFIESYSNSARTVQVRGYSKNEQIIADHTTSGDRSLATSVVPLTEFPDSITVRTAETSVSRGECYVKISIRVEGVVVALLSAGYVTDAGTIAHPNGKIESSVEGPGLSRMIQGTDPAAGVEISETVPTGARWKLKLLHTDFVASATVATRVPVLQISDGTIEYLHTFSSTGITANQTMHMTFGDFGARDASIAAALMGMVGSELSLPAGAIIKTVTASFQVGDNWSQPGLLVEEWIEP